MLTIDFRNPKIISSLVTICVSLIVILISIIGIKGTHDFETKGDDAREEIKILLYVEYISLLVCSVLLSLNNIYAIIFLHYFKNNPSPHYCYYICRLWYKLNQGFILDSRKHFASSLDYVNYRCKCSVTD